MNNSKDNKPKENDGKVGENKNGNNNGHLDESTNRNEVDPFYTEDSSSIYHLIYGEYSISNLEDNKYSEINKASNGNNFVGTEKSNNADTINILFDNINEEGKIFILIFKYL